MCASAGTAVTVESFSIWLANFEAEIRGTQKVSFKEESTAKITGALHKVRVQQKFFIEIN
jgi:hypothetical protein